MSDVQFFWFLGIESALSLVLKPPLPPASSAAPSQETCHHLVPDHSAGAAPHYHCVRAGHEFGHCKFPRENPQFAKKPVLSNTMYLTACSAAIASRVNRICRVSNAESLISGLNPAVRSNRDEVAISATLKAQPTRSTHSSSRLRTISRSAKAHGSF
jgi:hypothetical protein